MTDVRPDLAPVDPSTLPDPRPDNPLEALSWLGDTVEEIAEGLRARGIKGQRKDAMSCPLAGYLKLWWADVGIGRTFLHADNWPNGEQAPTFDLPATYGRFVEAFDKGAFPDLIGL